MGERLGGSLAHLGEGIKGQATCEAKSLEKFSQMPAFNPGNSTHQENVGGRLVPTWQAEKSPLELGARRRKD